jgi:hypothetical protein
MIKSLKIIRGVVRVILVLIGAWLVISGLAHLPRLFLGIGVILSGILFSVVISIPIKKTEGEKSWPERMQPGSHSRIGRTLLQPEILLVLFGFFFNFWWEVSQIPMYTGINRGISYFGENSVEMKMFFVQTFWRAAFLDALLILGAFLLVSQIYQDRYWFVRGGGFLGSQKRRMPSWIGYIVVTFVCVAFLIYLEISSFDQQLWEYSRLMPTLFTKIGLTPIGGLLISPTLVLLLVKRVCRAEVVSLKT